MQKINQYLIEILESVEIKKKLIRLEKEVSLAINKIYTNAESIKKSFDKKS